MIGRMMERSNEDATSLQMYRLSVLVECFERHHREGYLVSGTWRTLGAPLINGSGYLDRKDYETVSFH